MLSVVNRFKYWDLFTDLFLIIGFSILFIFRVVNGFVDYDSQAFQAIALHLLDGKILYKDVWDAKPFGVYCLNSLSFRFFGVDQNSIWVLQWIFGLFHILVFRRVGMFILKDSIITFGLTLSYVAWFYFSDLYQGGNFTEEYATVIMLSGVLFLLHYEAKKKIGHLFLSGFFLSAAIFLKEPYLFSILPWVFYLFWRQVKNGSKISTLALIAGLATPFIIYLGYLINTNSFEDYHKHLIYNLEYSRFQNLTLDIKLKNALVFFSDLIDTSIPNLKYLIIILIPALFFVRSKRILILVLFFEFILGWLSIGLSGYQFQHYYMQISPPLWLLMALMLIGLSSVIEKMFTSKTHVLKKYLPFALGLFLCLLSLQVIYQSSDDLKKKSYTYETIVEKVDELRSDSSTLFVQDLSHCNMYVNCNITCNQTIPVTFFTFFMVQDKFAVERIDKFVHSFSESPPTFILTGNSPGMLNKHGVLRSWFASNYELIYSEKGLSDTLNLCQYKFN